MGAIPIDPLALTLIAVAGACVGSFLNVVSLRLPRGESLIQPPSHCPRCGSRLRWTENVPVLGWLLLRGRCGHCGAAIPIRYPLVECLSALLWLAMPFARPGGMGEAPDPLLLVILGWILASWLLPLALVDIDRMWLPEPLCRWGVVAGLVLTGLVGLQQEAATARELMLLHLVAATLGLVGFEAVGALAQRWVGRPALGLGDAKLAAMIGAWLGPTGLGLAVAVAVAAGALVGMVARLGGLLGPRQPFPFGPFLAAGCLAVWIGGPAFWKGLFFPGL